jgi:hypothetical protein
LGFRISMPLEPLGSHDLALLGNCKGCNMFTAHGHGAKGTSEVAQRVDMLHICYIFTIWFNMLFPLLTIQNHTKKCKMSSFTHVHCAKGGGCGIIVRMTKGVLMRNHGVNKHQVGQDEVTFLRLAWLTVLCILFCCLQVAILCALPLLTRAKTCRKIMALESKK